MYIVLFHLVISSLYFVFLLRKCKWKVKGISYATNAVIMNNHKFANYYIENLMDLVLTNITVVFGTKMIRLSIFKVILPILYLIM